MRANRNKIPRTCAHCGQPFLTRTDSIAAGYGRFCSLSCARLSLPKADPTERFWALVDTRGPDECWPWRGTGHRSGYGLFTPISQMRPVGAHRFSYELAHGPIPRGLYVLHHCDNPPCVNPAHLYAGTPLDNMRDKVDRDRQPRGVGHGRAKLTEDDVRAIRKTYAAGRGSQTDLARMYGVSQPVISSLIRRETWAHIT